MYASDFEYDGKLLSDYGFIICEFNGSGGLETKETGYNISFNKVPRHGGRINGLAGTKYDQCVSCTFCICKNPGLYEDAMITNDEYRNIVRWLNRHEFHKFRMLHNDGDANTAPCYFNASFNIEKIYVADELVGLQLTAETDAPFGHGDPFDKTYTLTSGDVQDGKKIRVMDTSDESGYLRPDLTITCGAAGTLTLSNPLCDSTMTIKNCSVGEVIHIYGSTQIVTSSLASHKIYNDFNFEFLKIGNTFGSRVNQISSSMACTVRIQLYPVIKDIP